MKASEKTYKPRYPQRYIDAIEPKFNSVLRSSISCISTVSGIPLQTFYVWINNGLPFSYYPNTKIKEISIVVLLDWLKSFV